MRVQRYYFFVIIRSIVLFFCSLTQIKAFVQTKGCIFASIMNRIRSFFDALAAFFAKHLRYFGLPLVYLSIGLLVISYVLGMMNHNFALLPILFIPIGIYCYIHAEKQQGNY